MEIVYFSNVSENTHRFVQKLDRPAHRIPLKPDDLPLTMIQKFVLVTPTYGGGNAGGAVPKQVIKFLNDPSNRALLQGVVAAGNTNFGATYCRAGEIISRKCLVPLLYRFEILGTSEDVSAVESIITSLEELELE